MRRASAAIFIRTGLFILVSLIIPLTFVRADSVLSITRVTADVPGANAGRQSIEVLNSGTDPIDLGAKDIRLADGKGNHLIKLVNGSSILQPGQHAVIAEDSDKFLTETSNYTGALLKSSFSLTLNGTVSILQSGKTIATRTYTSPKPLVKVTSSTSRVSHTPKTKHSSNSKKNYAKGSVAPPATADAAAGGALSFPAFVLPPILVPLAHSLLPLFSSIWAAVFLGLLAFSAFSLIVMRIDLDPAPGLPPYARNTSHLT